jgi:hypothetical protein
MKNPDEPAPDPVGRRMGEEDDAIIDLHDISRRLGRGLAQIIGLALLGLAIAAVIYLVASTRLPVSTSTRVRFAFPGLEKGEYPDQSKFQPDDLRAPEVVAEALKRQGLDTTSEFQSRIRGALGIESVIPPDLMKQRDRMQAAGQSLPFYQPDEYIVTLSLPGTFPINNEQRARLLNEIVGVYRENFQLTYASIPTVFGHVFDTLHHADFPEYERIFDKEIDNITACLTQQLQQDKSFRSPTTNLSFKDLLERTQLFAQTQLSDTLELIDQSGSSRDPAVATARMEYSLRALNDQERRALGDEKVITDLLAQTQGHARNYVLGVKSEADPSHAETPIIDQGLIDSLLANDAYNYLVHRALDAGLKVSQVQADKAKLFEQLDALKSAKDDADNTARVQKSLAELEPAYQELIDNIRKTQADFARQQFGNAVQLGDTIKTEGVGRPLAITCIIGCFLGLAAGMGLSLLGIYIGSSKRS